MPELSNTSSSDPVVQQLLRYTPWGKPDHIHKVASGIYSLSTASHGGYYITNDRLKEMPKKYRKCAFFPVNGNWFEEDAAWCGVVLTFPEEFSAEALDAATKTYYMYYANA